MTIDEAKEIMNKAIENNKEIKFYGRMYGREFFRTIYSDKEVTERDKVIEITTSSLWVDVRDGFGYRWGSPEYNLYLWKDYGKTWAFSIDDFENKLVEKNEEYGWTDGGYTYWIEDDAQQEPKKQYQSSYISTPMSKKAKERAEQMQQEEWKQIRKYIGLE